MPIHPYWKSACCLFGIAGLLLGFSHAATAEVSPDNLDVDRLVAWCIVPFDAKGRNPAERTQMLKELGLRRCAYDWRQQHVAEFEEEIRQYQQHGIEFFAFWSGHPEAFKLFRKYDIHPQIWRTAVSPKADSQEARIKAAVEATLPAVKEAAEYGCRFGLYNHGGWGGEPENLVAVCQALRERGHDNVGIVYNFHHGHDEIADWETAFKEMQPFLLCLNLNGMNPGAQPKILPLGQGKHELDMIRVVRESGYEGPIGILDHRNELDAAESLRQNLDGLQWIRQELEKPGSGGPKPKGSQGPQNGELQPGSQSYRSPPLTVECVAMLTTSGPYNILVASDTKSSSAHWELFTMRGSGELTAYLPGYQPDHVRSQVNVCDGKSHHLAMTFEPGRIRLFVDGKQVASEHVTRRGKRPVPGGLGLGRLVEGTLNHHGQIDWVRLSDGIRPISEAQLDVPVVDERTVGLWTLKEGRFVAAPLTRQERPAAPAALAPSTPQYAADFVAEIARDALEKGDPVRGAAIFSNAKSACLSCHRVGTHGGTVGPELSKIGTEKKIAHLVESLFWPKREVKPEFKTWQVVTTEGQVLRGYRVKSADDVLVLRDPASGALTQVPMEEVEAVQEGSTLMPDQLTAAMSRQQQLDLIRFLTSLGKLDEAQRERINRTFAHASVHGPATFPYEREPIHPEQWPNADHPVNRDRLYDFYTKQAEYFRAQDPAPMLLSEFPGLDGGEQGHWGNQNEQSWADGRWNDTILGSVQCGIFRGAGVTVPRGVCVQLGETGEFATCFNPETLQYEVVWQGGFVSFSDVRHGFMHGIRMEGEVVSHPEKTSISQPFEYRGFYRDGRQVVFAYRIGDTEYLDAPSFVNGRFVRDVAPIEQHSLRHVLKGGDSQWPEQLTTPITPGTGRPYAVDTIELPFDNPWKALLFCGGHDFLPDGSALICTMQGDVWHVSGLDADPNKPGSAVWRRFASGLHHALGLVVDNGEIFVMGRDQLTRLHDLNGDGEADYYECFSNAFETSAAGHDFICGLQRDKRGRFYTASGNEGIVRISADGKRTEILATGFRNPDGLGLLPDGTITVPCSEGSWTPASMICAVPGQKASAPPFYGYGGPRNGKPPALPLVYIPRGLDNSSGGQVYVESDRWGPTEGQLVHLSFGSGTHFLVLQDVVAGQRQGALVPLPGDFRSGVHRGRFHPIDGQLYVSGMAGWGSYTADDGCFQRVRYTGPKAQLPQSFHVHENGVTVTFSQPLDRSIAENPASHFAQCWNYRYSEAYGSPEYSTTHPGVRGHDPLLIRSAHVLDDGRTLFLEIPDLQPVNQLHLRLHVDEGAMSPRGGHDLFATVHRLDQPFTDFESYRPEPKVIAVHPLLADLAANAQRVPNPFRKRIKGARKITIETGKNLTFATRRLTFRPGEAIEFTLRNPDVVPHNWALVKPGTLPTVGEMANRLISDPEAVSRHYIPATDDVLVYTDVVPAGNAFTIYFKAPATPGEYPYLCTFPGHWMVMNGTLVVE